ncbi:hypothetical protein HAHI6034_05785 [Hathewaya histolytica]|uniref:Uncharacterized protein n=1 Tax=Hathewaya histolytica TaxID=1498 RepID=A0A4U9RD80_HATHI|nr:hypothetical protein [Hathewaya histolytica]VTQ89702.1 Uncharacterised protein [Hathewaya histolytica]
MGFSNGIKKLLKAAYDDSKEIYETKEEEKRERKQRISDMKKEGIVFCPKCKSTCVTYTEKHKKLSVGRAITGGILAGGTGAVLGGLTSKKVKGKVKCLNCGHEWKPGKR